MGVVVFLEEGLFVVDTFGRAGGLLKLVADDDLGAEVEVCLDRFDVRGATGLVNGRFGGTPDLVEGFALSSERDGSLSAILCLERESFAVRTSMARQYIGHHSLDKQRGRHDQHVRRLINLKSRLSANGNASLIILAVEARNRCSPK